MVDFTGRVLVLGASGATGRIVLSSLQAKGIHARAFVRSPQKARGLQSPTTEIFVADILDSATLREAMDGCTAVISVIGTRSMSDRRVIEETEHALLVRAINTAKEAGIHHFILCSSMGTQQPERIPPLAHILRAKHKAEEALISSGLTYTIIHPGGLTDNPGGQSILVFPHPLPTDGMIPRADLAEVLVQALIQPEAANKSVDVIIWPDQGPATRPHLFA